MVLTTMQCLLDYFLINNFGHTEILTAKLLSQSGEICGFFNTGKSKRLVPLYRSRKNSVKIDLHGKFMKKICYLFILIYLCGSYLARDYDNGLNPIELLNKFRIFEFSKKEIEY